MAGAKLHKLPIPCYVSIPNIHSILVLVLISVLGCVVAEMALLSPLLEGEDTGDQVAVMMDMFGQPTDEDLEAMGVEDGTFTSALKILTVICFI